MARDSLPCFVTYGTVFGLLQFVPFRDFLGGKYGTDATISQAYLAKEVLAEIPEQITGWMKKHGVQPRPPPEPTTTTASAAEGGETIFTMIFMRMKSGATCKNWFRVVLD